MMFLSGNAQNHFASLGKAVQADFAPAAIVYENRVQIVNISAVRTEYGLGKIHFRKAELELMQLRLDLLVCHPVVPELIGDVALDYLARNVAGASQGKVSAEGRWVFRTDRVLKAPFNGFHDLRRRDRWLRAQEEM